MYIYNITLVPANMAVKWCVSSQAVELVRGIFTRGKKGSARMSGVPAFSLGVPKQVPLFSRAPMPHIVCRETVYVCARVSIGSRLKCR